MISFLLFAFILGLLIVVHEFGHFIAAKRIGVRVEKFSLGFGPQLLKKKKQHTEYTISAIPLGGYVKLAGDSLEEYKGHKYEYFSRTPAERFSIVFAGPLLNYVLGFLFFWLIFFAGYPTLTTKVGGLMDGYGAKEAGLQVGDKITAIDSRAVNNWEELQKEVHARKDASFVKVSYIRGGQAYTQEVSIKNKEVDDILGDKRKVGLLGITPYEEIIKVRHGFVKAFVLSVNKTWELTVITYKGLWRMLGGKMSLKDSVTGPLGIFFITSQAASMGIIAVLHLIAILNVSLAIFNLLPFPVLDGGHILFLGLEKVRGRSLGSKTERTISQIGFTLLLTFALFVTYYDFIRFFGDKVSHFFK